MSSHERSAKRSACEWSARHSCGVEHVEQRGGATSIFYVAVEEGPATLGLDPELPCDCPRLVGVRWIAAPSHAAWEGDEVRSLLKVRLT
jgi:8-oxo-dGTP diphosphatase